jgi:CRISPR/Cas system-associated exonuclease Cas4 (RecB family)
MMEKYSHNYGEYEMEKNVSTLLSKVRNSLQNIEVSETVKDDVNGVFDSWDKRGNISDNLNLRFGYRRGNVQAETQFGNVARFYADIMELEKAYQEGEINYGILILPKSKTAKEIGSNIANFEKAEQELKEMREIITVPMIVYGI